jgi:hypothetical protein
MLGNSLGAGHRDKVKKKLKESGRPSKKNFKKSWGPKFLKHVERVGPTTLVTAGQSSGYVELESVR